MDRRDFLASATMIAAASTPSVILADGISSNSTSNLATGQAIAQPITKNIDLKSAFHILDGVAPFSAIPATLSSELPQILKPIDTGAEALLTPIRDAQLSYSPMEVEYLVNSLEEHLGNCLSIREKAQQLETLAIAQRLELLLEGRTIDSMVAFSDFNQKMENRISGTMFDPVITDAALRGSETSEMRKYFEDKRKLEDNLILAHRDAFVIKKLHMVEPGSGNNHVERFSFLKETFDRELAEAYRRAKSIVVGLKQVYAIEKPVPDISDVGYLSKLAMWQKDVFYELERRIMRTTTTSFSVGLRRGGDASMLVGLLSDADFKTQRDASIFKFTIKSDFFEQTTLKLKRPRLRGLDAVIWSEPASRLDYMRVRVELPDQSIIGNDGNVTWSNKPTVILPLATYPQGADIRGELRREVHNASPVGEWTIQIDKRSLMEKETKAETSFSNLFLVMRVSSDMR